MSRTNSECAPPKQTHVPRVDLGRCEGKADCVAVCPYGVFEVRRLTDDDYARLSTLQKLKSAVHGRRGAYLLRADACLACGKCVTACPERAITLAPRAAP